MTSLPVAEADLRPALRLFLAVAGASVGLLATVILVEGNAVGAIAAALFGVLLLCMAIDLTTGSIALLAVSILVPTGVALYFGPTLPLVTFQRLTFLMLLGGVAFHAPIRYLEAIVTTPRNLLLLGMIMVMAIATLVSRNPALSQREFLSERGLGLPLYFAAVWVALRDVTACRRALWAFAAVGSVILLIAGLEALTGHGVVAQLGLLPQEKLLALGYRLELERRAGLPRVQSVFQHPLQLGAYLVVLMPLLVALRRSATGRWQRALSLVTLALGLLALVFTWSRGAWLALLLALLLSSGRGGRRWLLLGAGGAAFLLVWWRLGFLTGGALGYRWWLIRGVAHSVFSHYGFGTGLGTFSQNVIVRIASTSQTVGVDPLAYSLTMAIEAGPLFVVLLWWLVGGSLREVARARTQARDAGRTDVADLLGALRAGLLANLLLSLVTTSLFGTTEGLFITFMLLAVTLRLSRGDPAAPAALPPEPALAR